MDADEKKLLADFALRQVAEHQSIRRHVDTLCISAFAGSLATLGLLVPLILGQLKELAWRAASGSLAAFMASAFLWFVSGALAIRELDARVAARAALDQLRRFLKFDFFQTTVDPLLVLGTSAEESERAAYIRLVIADQALAILGVVQRVCTALFVLACTLAVTAAVFFLRSAVLSTEGTP